MLGAIRGAVEPLVSNAARKLDLDAAFLGVELSLTGRRWRTREADLGLVEAFRRRFSLPEIAARLKRPTSLIGRNVTLQHKDEKPRTLSMNLGDYSSVWMV